MAPQRPLSLKSKHASKSSTPKKAAKPSRATKPLPAKKSAAAKQRSPRATRPLADLATVVQGLESLTHDVACGGAYDEALNAYWQGEHDVAIETVSGVLAEDVETDTRFAAYRLWIEALAASNEKASLGALTEHLFTLGQAEPDSHETFAALRGLAHLELDEFEAAKLLSRACQDSTHDAYAMELVQLVEQRTESVSTPALLRTTGPLTDYFHWQTLAKGLVILKDKDALSEALTAMRRFFRGAPMPLVAEYHGQVEAGYFAGAAIFAERLCELYPANVDYQYYKAYALFEDGNYPAARATLARVVERHGEEDAEVVGLLGHCNAKLGDAERAKHYLMRAVSLLKAEGLPSSHMRLELANVEDELRGDALDPAIEMPRESRMWLVNLSARRYHELMTASDPAIERLLRPMGTTPREGDFVLFTAPPVEDELGQEQWNIVAIYTVDSEPMWHPVYRHHTSLKLVCRLLNPIPLDVKVREDDAGSPAASADDPINAGVYEIEQGHALDIIERAIEQQKMGIIERRSSRSARRPSA